MILAFARWSILEHQNSMQWASLSHCTSSSSVAQSLCQQLTRYRKGTRTTHATLASINILRVRVGSSVMRKAWNELCTAGTKRRWLTSERSHVTCVLYSFYRYLLHSRLAFKHRIHLLSWKINHPDPASSLETSHLGERRRVLRRPHSPFFFFYFSTSLFLAFLFPLIGASPGCQH